MGQVVGKSVSAGLAHTACSSVQSDQHPIVKRLLEVSNLTSHKGTFNVLAELYWFEPDFGRIIQRQVFSWLSC